MRSSCSLLLVLLCLGLSACGDDPVPAPPDDTVAEAATAPSKLDPIAQPVPSDPTELALAEEERQRIGDIEHHVLKLGQKGMRPIAGHIRARNVEGVRTALTETFQGAVLAEPPFRDVSGGLFRTRRLTRADSPDAVVQMDADALVAKLIAWRDEYGDAPGVGFKVRGAAPLDDAAMDGAWSGHMRLQMSGEDAQGGVRETSIEFEFELARMPGVDEIAEASGWIRALRVVEVTEVVATEPLFVESGKQRGIDRAHFRDNLLVEPHMRRAQCGGVFLLDIDDDDWTDILIMDHEGLRLYRAQRDGTFADVTKRSLLPADTPPMGAVAAGDFDGDGTTDLILGTRAYRNNGEGRFLDVSHKAVLPGRRSSAYTLADFDLDGRLDIYVSRSDGMRGAVQDTTWFDGPGGPGNQLWINRGNWRFEEVAERAGATAGKRSVFTAGCLDANDDGRPDVYAISEFGPGALLLNRPDGTFEEVRLEDDDGDFGTMGLAVGDYDGDGRIDVYTANMYSKAGRRIIDNLAPGTYPDPILRRIKRFVTGSELYRALGPVDGRLRFERMGERYSLKDVGWAYGAVFSDFDSDGALDLHALCGFISVDPTVPDG